MYITQISIYKSRSYPLAAGMIYQLVAEAYNLPTIETLLKSLKNDVIWPTEANRLQVYYLEPLTEDNETDIFQIRFSTTLESRELISIFLSIQTGIIKNITFSFPGRTGRGAGSKVIAAIKSVCHN